jgi:hypothetical protein
MAPALPASEATPVHDEALGHHEQHAAALTLQRPTQVDQAAALARPHPARLRLLLEGLAAPDAPGGPNRAAAWAQVVLSAAFDPTAQDAEPYRAEVAAVGSELASAASALAGWLLMGAVREGLLPEDAVAQALHDDGRQDEEAIREAELAWQRLQALALDIRALTTDGTLSEAIAGQLLRYLPEEIYAQWADDAAFKLDRVEKPEEAPWPAVLAEPQQDAPQADQTQEIR